MASWRAQIQLYYFIGAIANLRIPTIIFVMSVRLSVCLSIRMEQLGSHWSDLGEIWYEVFFFENLSRKF
jgi:hypothetical protein